MKLIVEATNESDVKVISETAENGEKKHYISGIFMQANTPNRNKRIYPADVMFDEVGRYNANFVQTRRAVGELGHPASATLNLERVSHLITEMNMQGNNVYGKALILDTDYGRIAKAFINDGVQLGVSSRALGSVKTRNGLQEVQNDFRLVTVDIVADPSAPEAFVNGIMEGREFYYSDNAIVEKHLDGVKKQLKESKTTKEQHAQFLKDFYTLLSKL